MAGKERHKIVPAVYLFLLDGEKILLLRRSDSNLYKPGWYSLPAGHVDGNESATDAIIREAKEEANIDLKREDLKMTLCILL
mgnify:CR=1 FL=1